MGANHTHGPWVTGSGEFGVIRVPGVCGQRIATVAEETMLRPYREGEMLANARLIAAAPELLDVLRRALAATGCEADCQHYWHVDAKELIERVEGRQ